MKRKYRREVRLQQKNRSAQPTQLILEEDIAHLPEPVQRFMRFTGVIGRARPHIMMVKMRGRIRSSPDSPWMSLRSEQVNWFDQPFRAFFMRAWRMGIPASGLHLYRDAAASMEIRLAGLLKIVDARGPKMNQSETVTVLNDMLFLAPGALLHPGISWQPVDGTSTKVSFTNGGITVGALVTFDPDGRLVNFMSNDRYESTDGKTYNLYPWKTPVKKYGSFGGLNLPSLIDVIYTRPEGDFCYGTFEMTHIRY
jgi:hypothetical protein